MEEEIKNRNRNQMIQFWENLFNFLTNRTTIILCSSCISLLIIFVAVFMLFKGPKVNGPSPMKSAFSAMPYDLCGV